MITVRHAHQKEGRQSAFGVEFIDGVGQVEELHPERELALLQHGFTVEKTSELTGDGPFEALVVAVEGDDKPKVSRRRKA